MGQSRPRSLSTQRRNLCILCPSPSRMETFFKLLGICFDCKLRMDLAVRDVVSQASWKLTTILRTRRFHGVSQLVQVYKSKVLSFVEHRTPAVFQAAETTLAGIDAVQRRFLRECGLSDEDALLHFNLAPLETRRDIAMLGLISSFGSRMWPEALCEHVFALCRRRFLRNTTNNFYLHRSPPHLPILSRSAWGLVDVYNLLPAQVVGQKSVASMQHELQTLL